MSDAYTPLLHWPELAARLAERRAAFVDAAREQAQRRGLGDALLQARYLNLCCAFGPGFEDRPEHEWALALLLDERLAPAVRLHQLLVRAPGELRRAGQAQAAETLKLADQALLDAFEAESGPEDVLRQACDVEAFELRVRHAEPMLPYRWAGDSWQRSAGAGEPAPLRVTASEPAPPRLHLLAAAAGQGAALRLQLRQAMHGQCRHGLHPAVRWVGRHGLSQWQGPVARELSWNLDGPRPSGLAIGEESSPEISILELPSCGVRDAGVPLGAQKLQLWTYPAQQRLWSLQRRAPLQWRDGLQPVEAQGTRLRVERDGEPESSAAAQQRFEQALPAAWAAGMAALQQAWQRSVEAGVAQAQSLWFDGRAGCTWGYVPGVPALQAEPLLRLAVQAELQFAQRIELSGELAQGGARTRLSLRCEGQQPLAIAQELLGRHGMPAALPLLKTGWRWPWRLEFEPIAGEGTAFISQLGPATGGLVGEAGLRPRSEGSGYCWYLKLELEPLALPLRLHDALLGDSELHLALLPAQTLIDWSSD